MTDNENIYDDWRRTLDGLGLQADDRSQQKARVVAARAQVDQAISLATIADSLDQLVEALRRPMTPDEKRRAEAVQQAQVDALIGDKQPESQGIQSEHDVEVGDAVAPLGQPSGYGIKVAEIGTSEGDLWIKLEGSNSKMWAKDYVVVEEPVTDAEPQVIAPEPMIADAEPTDDIDDDFGTEAVDADEQQADALAALRARQGKGKKATRK